MDVSPTRAALPAHTADGTEASARRQTTRELLTVAVPSVVLTTGLAVVAGEHTVLLHPAWRGHPVAAVVNLVAALALLAAGVALLRSARTARAGWSLVAVAVLWPITRAGVSLHGTGALISFVSSAAVPAVLALGVFSYPGDLPRSRPSVGFLAVAAAAVGVGTTLLLLVGQQWFGFAEGAARAVAVLQVATVIGAVLALPRHLRRMSPIEVRNLLPAAAGALLSCLIAAGTTVVQGGAPTPRAQVTSGLLQGLALLVVPACVVGSWWHTRQLRTRIAGLMHDLRTAHSAVAVRAALRDHLGDPTVEILYRVAGPSTYVDGDGLPLTEEITAGRLTVRVPTRPPFGADAPAVADVDAELALVTVSAHLRPHQEHVTAAVLAAGFVLHNIRLRAQLHARLEEVDRSLGQILDAEEEELRAFALEHGDALQQRLLGLAMRAQAARAGVTDPSHDEEWAVLATTAIRASGEAAAIARGVYAPRLSSGGLQRALEDITDHPGLAIELDVEEGGDLHTQRAAYLCLSEALSNVVKHARAERVWITVRPEGRGMRLVVADDGIGGVRESGDVLTSLRSRAALAGGTVTVASPPGGGTAVTTHLPGVDSPPR